MLLFCGILSLVEPERPPWILYTLLLTCPDRANGLPSTMPLSTGNCLWFCRRCNHTGNQVEIKPMMPPFRAQLWALLESFPIKSHCFLIMIEVWNTWTLSMMFQALLSPLACLTIFYVLTFCMEDFCFLRLSSTVSDVSAAVIHLVYFDFGFCMHTVKWFWY